MPVPKKVLISLDEPLLRRIDEAAKARGLTRSRFLSELARREVSAQGRPPEEQREIGEAIARLHALAARAPRSDEPSEATIRRMRDERTERLARS